MNRMKMAKGSASPKYLDFLETLRAQIERGELALGDTLPREDRLSEERGVSIYAVREALRLLERQGYVERKRRAGTKIISHSPTGVFRHVVGSRRDFLQLATSSTIDYESAARVATDGQLARLLGCDEGREWYFLLGIRFDVERRPLGVTRIYIDAQRGTVPPDADFGQHPVFEWVERQFGLRATSVSQDVSAVPFSGSDAEIFGQVAGSPALRMVRRYFDEKGKIFQITVNTHPSETFVYNLRVDLTA